MVKKLNILGKGAYCGMHFLRRRIKGHQIQWRSQHSFMENKPLASIISEFSRMNLSFVHERKFRANWQHRTAQPATNSPQVSQF